MAKMAFNPNAYLSEIRNVRKGLVARSRILEALEEINATAGALAKETALSYKAILHHLRLLETENIISRKTSKKPYYWELTGGGQQRLRTV
jgi:predicted transcriptional regulator